MEDEKFYKMINLKVIENITRCGGDLNKHHQVEFFIYVPNEEDAYRAAAIIQKVGFEVEVSQSGSDSDWLCLATMKMKPKLSDITKISMYLAKLAESFGGNYDGWETPIDF
ncbi:MAG: ribonuclease E inhibitor RraB [Bacteroidetes bacterium]|nr:ribonuclease E inhibitor RraB [Bacteroidota bacterium]